MNDNSQMPPSNSRGFDPFFKLAPLLNLTSHNFHLRYRPHLELSIDEAIVGYKGRHRLKMYNPNKPQKWGFKVRQQADAHSWCVLSQILYRGKPHDPLPYGQGYEVVTDLTAQHQWLRHHLYMDILPPLHFSGTHTCEAQFVQTASVCQMELLQYHNYYMFIFDGVLTHNDFSPSVEQPQRCLLPHML